MDPLLFIVGLLLVNADSWLGGVAIIGSCHDGWRVAVVVVGVAACAVIYDWPVRSMVDAVLIKSMSNFALDVESAVRA
jgi:uncharacterized membrane protein